MTRSAKRGLVPKLRFPEFREAGEWEVDELGTVAVFVNEKIPVEQVALENYVSTENILQDFGGVARASKLPTMGTVTRFRLLDTLVSNIRPYLKKVWVADKEGGASNDVIVIRAKQRLLPQYFSFLLKNDTFIDYVMTSAKGVKMPRGDIGSMKAYPALYPTKPEQQKIADCLASLDERITLETQKLDTLKTHKKGLMQQLFPAEGETLPKLRFPEFRDAGEWVEKLLGSSIEEFREKSTVQDEFEVLTSARSGLVRQREYYDNDRITERDNIGFNIVPPNYLTYRSRSDDRQFYFNENDLGITGIVSTYYPVFRVLEGSNKFFVELLACYSTIVGKHSVGTSQTVLSLNELRRIKLPIPKEAEQQKIADCLASLDDHITAQTQKLAALKTHKKGLMQQLFPFVGGVPRRGGVVEEAGEA